MSMCEPGCNHPSHQDEGRNEKLAQLQQKIQEVAAQVKSAPPHLVDLAFKDVVYQLTRVGRILQKVDRLILTGHAASSAR